MGHMEIMGKRNNHKPREKATLKTWALYGKIILKMI